MVEFLWRMVAFIVCRPRVTSWLIRRAMRTPYTHLTSADGRDIYMFRYWLFNPYDNASGTCRFAWCPISVRIHHICRHDLDRCLHDHPWNARTVILRGGYAEVRESGLMFRFEGDTAGLRFGEYHRIVQVDEELGAWTLFITGRKRGTWGFLVDGKKVPYREYLGMS